MGEGEARSELQTRALRHGEQAGPEIIVGGNAQSAGIKLRAAGIGVGARQRERAGACLHQRPCPRNDAAKGRRTVVAAGRQIARAERHEPRACERSDGLVEATQIKRAERGDRKRRGRRKDIRRRANHGAGKNRRRARIGRRAGDRQRAGAECDHRPVAGKDRRVRRRTIAREAELQDGCGSEIASEIVEQKSAAPDRAERQRIGPGIVDKCVHRGVGQAGAETPPAGESAGRVAVGDDKRIADIVGIVESADEHRVDAVIVDEGERCRADEIGRQIGGQRCEGRALIDRAEKVLAVGDEKALVGAQIEFHRCRREARIGRQRRDKRSSGGGGAEKDSARRIIKQAPAREHRIGVIAGAVVDRRDKRARGAKISQCQIDVDSAWCIGAGQCVLRDIDVAAADGDAGRVDVVEHQRAGKMPVRNGDVESDRRAGREERPGLGADNRSRAVDDEALQAAEVLEIRVDGT